jgi:hypothetical protein
MSPERLSPSFQKEQIRFGHVAAE